MSRIEMDFHDFKRVRRREIKKEIVRAEQKGMALSFDEAADVICFREWLKTLEPLPTLSAELADWVKAYEKFEGKQVTR